MSTLYHATQFPTIPATPGIYKITCTVTGKFYIGSATNLFMRWKTHFNSLQRNAHKNPKLQNAWNKYGKDAFVFEVMEIVLIPELLTAREQYWFNKLRPFGKRGFNIDRVAGSPLGRKASQATRDKMSAIRKGKPNYQLGRKASLATRKKMKASHLGQKQSEATIKKRLLTYSGRPMSPQERARQSIAKSDKMGTLIVISPEGKEQTIHGIKKFCREHNLHSGHLVDVAKGKAKQHKGWKARFPETDVS